MMKVVYSAAALKALDKVPAQDRVALRRKLVAYAESGTGDVVKLAGSDEWRLRHGNWRAIFLVTGNLFVVRIAHRRDVYR